MAAPIDRVYYQNCMQENIGRGYSQTVAHALCYPVAVARAVPGAIPAPGVPGAPPGVVVEEPFPWLGLGLVAAAVVLYYALK